MKEWSYCQGRGSQHVHARCSQMRKVILVLLVAAMAAVLMSAREAHAQTGNIVVHRTSSVGFGNNWCGGFNNIYGPYSWNRTLGYIPTPPYFALHPPVYYSHPVAAPYGVSPYPITSISPGATVVADRSVPKPEVVINPYVKQDVAEESQPADQSPVTKIVAGEDAGVVPQPPAVIDNSF